MSIHKAPQAAEARTIYLCSVEGEKFGISTAAAELSVLVKEMNDGEEDGADVTIPLPNVSAVVLEQVVAFCEHHVKEPMDKLRKPLPSATIKDFVPEWYANFVEIDRKIIFDLVQAANYMDIKPLLDLTCAKIACMIKGKTVAEIRETFNAVHDLTPEEKSYIANQTLPLDS